MDLKMRMRATTMTDEMKRASEEISPSKREKNKDNSHVVRFDYDEDWLCWASSTTPS